MYPTTASHDHDVEQCHPAHVEALIQEFAPLVKYIAQRLACRLPASVCLDDLISAGVLGLLDALETYDSTRGTTFKTSAEGRVRGAMLDYLREFDWVPSSVREKEQALTQAYAEIEHRQGHPADDEEVAALLGLELDAFSDWLTDVRGISLVSLDTRLVAHAAGRQQPAEIQDLTRHLAAAIDQLPEREKVVLSLYYYEELTMREIGTVLEVTESRISQLHTKALLHLRAALQTLTHGAYATVG